MGKFFFCQVFGKECDLNKKNPGNFKILSVSKTKATLHTIFLRLRQLFILFLLFQPQWKWMREFFFSQVLGKECDLNKAIMRKSHTNEALMERNLMSKLLYYSLVSYEETETDTENYENNPLVPTESHSHVKGGLTSESILISFRSSTG